MKIPSGDRNSQVTVPVLKIFSPFFPINNYLFKINRSNPPGVYLKKPRIWKPALRKPIFD